MVRWQLHCEDSDCLGGAYMYSPDYTRNVQGRAESEDGAGYCGVVLDLNVGIPKDDQTALCFQQGVAFGTCSPCHSFTHVSFLTYFSIRLKVGDWCSAES